MDDALPLATYSYNIVPFVDLQSPFYLVHGRDPLEGRLSNLQNYCRYVRDQPGQLAVQELRKMWKLQAKLFEENRRTDPAENMQITKASDLKNRPTSFFKGSPKGYIRPNIYL